MASPVGKSILIVVAVVAVTGIVYLTVGDRVGSNEGAEGAIGVEAGSHQAQKTQYYQELNQREQIEDLARIAAKFETNPTEAEKLLAVQGWSKAEFDKMVAEIARDEDRNRAFQAAKKLAAQS